MATRPALRALSTLTRTTTRRHLHMTDPANLHETRTASDIVSSPQRPTTAATAPETMEEVASSERAFSSSARLAAYGDSSTIDFAYLPAALDPDAHSELPARMPLLLNTMYNGSKARAMYEDDEPEAVSTFGSVCLDLY
jgi:hypothetical protein